MSYNKTMKMFVVLTKTEINIGMNNKFMQNILSYKEVYNVYNESFLTSETILTFLIRNNLTIAKYHNGPQAQANT